MAGAPEEFSNVPAQIGKASAGSGGEPLAPAAPSEVVKAKPTAEAPVAEKTMGPPEDAAASPSKPVNEAPVAKSVAKQEGAIVKGAADQEAALAKGVAKEEGTAVTKAGDAASSEQSYFTVDGKATRERLLKAGDELGLTGKGAQRDVYVDTVNDYTQKMIDGARAKATGQPFNPDLHFDWTKGDPIRKLEDGTILSGHHRWLAANKASRALWVPLNDIIPPNMIKVESRTEMQAVSFDVMNSLPGSKAATPDLTLRDPEADKLLDGLRDPDD
jgi:hypothetical protein